MTGQSGNRRDNFELLERAVALARPCVNQRQVINVDRTLTESLAIGTRSTARRASRMASSFRPSPASSLAMTATKYDVPHPWPCRPMSLPPFARGCKRRQRFLLIAARTRNHVRHPNSPEVAHRKFHPPTSQE